MRIVVVDPGHQVPAYDRALAGALAAGGDAVTLATAPLLYDRPGDLAAGVTRWQPFGRLLALPACRRLRLDRRPVLRRMLRALSYPLESSAFARATVRARPSVVHWQWSLAPVWDAMVFRALRRAGCPVVYTAHNLLPHERRPWHEPFLRRLHRSADRIIVHSEATKARLIARGDVGAAILHVVPMPADEPGAVPPRAAARDALQLPVDGDTPVVLFFGHLRPYKGFETLLDAMQALRVRGTPAHLLVAGPVAGGARGMAGVEAAVGERGLTDVTILRHGYVPERQRSLYFAAVDVVALPYREVTDSAVLAAALGHGRAAVVADVGGLAEALRDGGGVVVPPGEAGALAEALEGVLGEPGCRDRLEAEARAAARRWTWADAAARTRQVYAEVAAEAVP